MSLVNTDEIGRVPNHRMGHVWPTQRSVGEATSKLKGHGLWRHSLCRDTCPYVLSEWHMQQCTCFFFNLTQIAQTMLPPWAICCAYGHPQVPCLPAVGTPGRQKGLSGVRPPRIIFCYIVWDVTDTRAPINSSQCSSSWESKSDSAGCSLWSHFDSMH